ncbi:MAG: YitT family protein [Deltaproteobacteria bacterium]|nr:YitT family protein [Deltaproteobacteria bacterium]
MKGKLMRNVFDWTSIIIGSLVMALAFDLFLVPNNVVPGGVTGIAMLLNYWFHTPIGMVTVIANIPLFGLGIKVLGKSYGIKSIAGMLLSSIMIDFFMYIVPLEAATHDQMLASIFGGIVLGAGLGLVFRGGGSTGGADIVAQVWAKYSNLSTGTTLLIIDFVVISAAGLAYHGFETVMYGYLNLYIHARVVDLVLEGVSYTRAVFVVSKKAETIAEEILEHMNRGATLLAATGAYSGIHRNMVFSVMSKKEIARARELIRVIDPDAFVTITDVHEVLGQGFRPRMPTGSVV